MTDKQFISQGTIRIEVLGKGEYRLYFSPSIKFSISSPRNEKKQYGLFIPHELTQKSGSTDEEKPCAKACLVTESEVEIHGADSFNRLAEFVVAAENKTLVEVKVAVGSKKKCRLSLKSISIPAPVQK